MLGSQSLFRSLSAQEGKRLKAQLKDYLRDYAISTAEDLAEIWHEEQSSLAEGTWLESYLRNNSWSREVPRAIVALRREADHKASAKTLRAQAKERHLDRQPATDKQKKYLTKLTKKRPDFLPAPIEGLSKLQASRLIQQALDA